MTEDEIETLAMKLYAQESEKFRRARKWNNLPESHKQRERNRIIKGERPK